MKLSCMTLEVITVTILPKKNFSGIKSYILNLKTATVFKRENIPGLKSVVKHQMFKN